MRPCARGQPPGRRAGADLGVSPELLALGYPPRDLLCGRPCCAAGDGSCVPSPAKLPRGFCVCWWVGRAPWPAEHLPALHQRGWPLVGAWRLGYRGPQAPACQLRRSSMSAVISPGWTRPACLPWSVAPALGDRLNYLRDLWVEGTCWATRAGPDPIAELVAQRPDLLLNISASHLCRASRPCVAAGRRGRRRGWAVRWCYVEPVWVARRAGF